MERAYRNLGYVLIPLLPIFIAGFWIPYFSEFPNFDASITTAVHIHAVLLFCFLGLLIVQPLAIRFKAFSITSNSWKDFQRSDAIHTHTLSRYVIEGVSRASGSGASVTAARNAEFLSAAQLTLLATFYGLAIACIRKRDVSAHMRYMICIVLILLPAGLARTLGYWFNVRQSSSQTLCLLLIDAFLIALIIFDKRRKVTALPYIAALLAYIVIEACWVSLGRPV